METIKQEFDDVMYFVGFNMKIAGNKLQQWGEQIDQWGKSWGEPEQHIINVNKVVVIEETTENIMESCVATTGFASKRYLNKDDISIATRN